MKTTETVLQASYIHYSITHRGMGSVMLWLYIKMLTCVEKNTLRSYSYLVLLHDVLNKLNHLLMIHCVYLFDRKHIPVNPIHIMFQNCFEKIMKWTLLNIIRLIYINFQQSIVLEIYYRKLHIINTLSHSYPLEKGSRFSGVLSCTGSKPACTFIPLPCRGLCNLSWICIWYW